MDANRVAHTLVAPLYVLDYAFTPVSQAVQVFHVLVAFDTDLDTLGCICPQVCPGIGRCGTTPTA